MGRSRKVAKGQDDVDTTHVRVLRDIAKMINEVRRVENKKQYQLVDELIRPALEARHARYKSLIDKMKKAEADSQPD